MNNHVISKLCVLVSCLLYAEADMTEALSKVSSVCRSTPGACHRIVYGGAYTPRSEAEFCSIIRGKKFGFTGYQCGMSIGFCTDQEFHDLEKAACGETSIVPRPSSNIKTTFYNKVATINSSCHYKLIQCIERNALSTIFKQQEQYCKLVNSRSMVECMGLDCIRDLKQVACATDQSQPFSDAIVGTTQKCQDAIEVCASHIFATALIRLENYCSLIDPSQYRFGIDNCLQQKNCTKAEVNNLRTAACSSSGNGSGSGSGSGSLYLTAMSNVSNLCKSTTKVCVALAGKSAPVSGSEAEWCSLMRMTKDGVTGYQCGVSIGFCTDQEFLDLEKAACGETTISPRPSSNAKTTFYNKIASIYKRCQDIWIACVAKNVVSTVFKQQEQYCKLVNSRSMVECLGLDCIRGLNQTACATYESQSFSDAIVGTAHACQDALQKCVYPTFALALIRAGKYCEALNYAQDGIIIADCLKQNKCTEAAVSKLRIAACSSSDSGSVSISGSYIVGSLLVFIFAVLPHV